MNGYRNSDEHAGNETDNEGMKDLIATMNKLHDILTLSGQEFIVDLPQIAVVGAQSAGKSSVLEGIVGREFLPRGRNIVTRRPIIIQFITFPTEEAVFLHKPDEIFKNFKDVQKEIEKETDRLTGNSKSVSSTPMNLKIYSPNVLNLTLVDLPGLTKVPVHGQPSNIDEIIWKMVRKFIQQENCIILAVTAATQDIATSDALKMARGVDPKGDRTIGVITHLDAMSPGTNARAILENTVFPLKRGYVGVVNRNQDDINNNRDIYFSLQKEKDFFRETIHYSDMADRMGIKYLQKLLNKELEHHIKQRLQSLRAELYNKIIHLKKELGNYQTADYSDTGSCLKYIVMYVNSFIEDLKASLIGNSDNANLGTICSGAHINNALYDDVQVKMKIDLTVGDEAILKAIVNSNAIRTGFLLPQAAFDCLCREVIIRYRVPVLNAVNIIGKLTVEAVKKSAEMLGQYPRLRDEVIFKVKNKIAENEEKTKEHLLNHIEAEISFINVRHPDFISIIQNFAQFALPKDSHPHKLSENKIVEDKSNNTSPPMPISREASKFYLSHHAGNPEPAPLSCRKDGMSLNCDENQIEKLGQLVSSYMNIVDKTIKDIALKYIVCFIVRHTIDYVSRNLVPDLSAVPNMAIFFEECSEEVKVKENLKKKIVVIEKAMKIISEI